MLVRGFQLALDISQLCTSMAPYVPRFCQTCFCRRGGCRSSAMSIIAVEIRGSGRLILSGLEDYLPKEVEYIC